MSALTRRKFMWLLFLDRALMAEMQLVQDRTAVSRQAQIDCYGRGRLLLGYFMVFHWQLTK